MRLGRFNCGGVCVSPNYGSYNYKKSEDVICLTVYRDKEIDREGCAVGITLNEAKYIRDTFDKILMEVDNGF